VSKCSTVAQNNITLSLTVTELLPNDRRGYFLAHHVVWRHCIVVCRPKQLTGLIAMLSEFSGNLMRTAIVYGICELLTTARFSCVHLPYYFYSVSSRHNVLLLHRTFCRAMLCISAAYAVMRCMCVYVCVRVSVTFVNCVETNRQIIKIFSPSGSHTILVFPCQTA